MMFLDCPAYLDAGSAVRCGLPAEVRCRFTVCSTVGPLESAMIRCPAGHSFNGPIESLTWDSSQQQAPGQAAVTSGAGLGAHQGRVGGGRLAIQGSGEPGREARRPNSAPAYYLGRPAGLYVIALRPRRRHSSDHPEPAVIGSAARPGRPLTGAGPAAARMIPAVTPWPVLRAG